MTPKRDGERPYILHFFEARSLKTTVDALGVLCPTLYRWRAVLKASVDNPATLALVSCAPRKL